MDKGGSYTKCLLARKSQRITAWIPAGTAIMNAKIETLDGVAKSDRAIWKVVEVTGERASYAELRQIERLMPMGMTPFVLRPPMSVRLPAAPGRRPIKKLGLAALIAALASSCALGGAPAIAEGVSYGMEIAR